MQDESIYFKVMSLLLQYPDEAYIRALPELKSAVDQLHHGQRRAGIEAFIADVEACSVLQLQERYTALFDMSPATTLNITYHLWGDGEKRARLLTGLQQEYACAGFEKTTAELPDFLPLILEFMAAVPQAQWSETIQKSLEGIETVVDRLRPIATPFAELLDPLASMFRQGTEKRAAAGLK
jgi:nitrate reductase delta subunit